LSERAWLFASTHIHGSAREDSQPRPPRIGPRLHWPQPKVRATFGHWIQARPRTPHTQQALTFNEATDVDEQHWVVYLSSKAMRTHRIIVRLFASTLGVASIYFAPGQSPTPAAEPLHWGAAKAHIQVGWEMPKTEFKSGEQIVLKVHLRVADHGAAPVRVASSGILLDLYSVTVTFGIRADAPSRKRHRVSTKRCLHKRNRSEAVRVRREQFISMRILRCRRQSR
jgi:hypothetical protein